MLNSDRIHAFIKAIPKKYALIDINLNSQNFIDDRDIDCKINKNYILDLHHDYKLLHEAFSSNTRRNLHEAKGNHLTVVEGIPSQNIIDLFRKDKGKEIRSFKENDYKTLHQLMNHILDKGKAISLGVNDANNQLLAGAFFVKHNNRYIFLFSGNSDEGRDAKAMFFLIDYFIRKYSNEDLILDFEGSNNHGLARFYSSFGAKKIQYKTYFANRLFFPLNLLFMVYRKFK